jgi:hypothetical protein
VKGRGPEASNGQGLASPRGLAPKTLIYIPRDPHMERSVQFNLLSLETMHHGKCTLGSNASTQAQVASSKGGLAQLVERLLCKQNVNGSNPLTSTT